VTSIFPVVVAKARAHDPPRCSALAFFMPIILKDATIKVKEILHNIAGKKRIM
jgi:hypothetical protein